MNYQQLTYAQRYQIENYNKAGYSITKIADPYFTWQRGLNEYNNKLIRQYLPKKTDFNQTSDQTISMIISKLNNKSRKLLGYKTPNEVFLANFKLSVALIT